MRELIQIITLIRKHKGKIAVVTIFIILILGTIGFYQTLKEKNILASIFKSITLLGLNVPETVNLYNGLAFVLAVVLVYAGFFLLAFNNLLNKWLFKLFLRDKNVVLFGFGEINKNFLENFRGERKNDNVIVVDKEDKDFDEFWEEGYVFLKKEIDDELIEKFDFEKTTDIVVALGNDRVNIDVALKLIDKLKDVKTETKLIVHISDRDISDLFFEKLEKVKKEKSDIKINLKTFSFDTEVVDDLFEKYDTKLVPYEYAKLNSEKKLKLAVIGNSGVSIELIKRLFINFIFPNEIKIKIFLIDKNEKEFLEKVEFETNYSKEKFPHIELETKKLNYDLLKNKDFWLDKDLIDVFIAFEDENRNLEVAVDLFEKVFVHLDKENLKYPNIFFAMYEELAFSDYIDDNKENFKNFFTFGSMKKILSVKNLLDDEKFEGAKQIHFDYGVKFDEDKIVKDEDKLNEKWFNSAKYSDKLSNIAQYEHIPYKLLSLGFYKQKSDKDIKELLKYNQKLLFCKLKEIGMLDKDLIFKFSCEVESSYDEKVNYKFNEKVVDEFWEKFLNSGDFLKLIEVEHKRWMAYHYLNGWEKDDKKDKLKKLHNCLVDIKKFDDYGRKLTIIYDIYSYLYLPNYLAAGKYEIKP